MVAAPASTVCENIRWGEFAALRLSNGVLEIVVVPALGRMMHFARVGGKNWLWTDELTRENGSYVSVHGWENWGGDKTWLAPQSSWEALCGVAWPPDPAWGDPAQGPHEAVELDDGGLRVIGPVSRHSGLRIAREYHFDENELVVRQIVENVTGPARTVALWSVTNVPPPAATWFAPSPKSAHPEGFWKSLPATALDTAHRDGLLVVKSGIPHRQKIGLDTPWVALAAQRPGELLIQRAESFAGPYPHGGGGTGSSVEYFDTGTDYPEPYVELELLGPLTTLAPGERATLAMRWRIEAVASAFPAGHEDFARLGAWLRAPVPSIHEIPWFTTGVAHTFLAKCAHSSGLSSSSPKLQPGTV